MSSQRTTVREVYSAENALQGSSHGDAAGARSSLQPIRPNFIRHCPGTPWGFKVVHSAVRWATFVFAAEAS